MANLITKIFDGQTVDGNSAAIRIYGLEPVTYQGNFGTGTVILQVSSDNGTTWVTVPLSTSLVATSFNVTGRGRLFRANLDGATAASLDVIVGSI